MRRVGRVQTLPTISDVVATDVGDDTFTIRFTTDKAARASVQYGTTSALGSEQKTGGSRLSHVVTVTGLSSDTYYYRAVAYASTGRVYSATASVDTGPGSGPFITNVVESSLADTSIRIEWNVDPASTGQVDYGTAADDLSSSSEFEPSFLTYHSQLIEGLTAGTLYYYQVKGTDATGHTGTSDIGSFTTNGAGETTGLVLGGGIGMTSLANTTITGVINPGAYRFRARYSSAVSTIRMYWEGGSGYAAGTGGTYTVTIVPDTGTGVPDLTATPLATKTGVTPGASGSIGYLITFTGATALVAGVLYHVVFTNVHATPASNYASLNCVYDARSTADPRHPRWPDTDWAMQYLYSGAWVYRTGFAPNMDIVYANGSHHLGCSYMELSYSSVPTYVGHVYAASTRRIRQEFIPDAAATVDSVGIKCQKASGVTAALAITLKNSGGSSLATASIAAASVGTGTMAASDRGTSGSTWVSASLSVPVALSAAATYYLEFSTTGDGQYMTWPMRKGSSSWGYDEASCEWPGGQAQYSTNDGGAWSNISGSDDDFQCYLGLV